MIIKDIFLQFLIIHYDSQALRSCIWNLYRTEINLFDLSLKDVDTTLLTSLPNIRRCVPGPLIHLGDSPWTGIQQMLFPCTCIHWDQKTCSWPPIRGLFKLFQWKGRGLTQFIYNFFCSAHYPNICLKHKRKHFIVFSICCKLSCMLYIFAQAYTNHYICDLVSLLINVLLMIMKSPLRSVHVDHLSFAEAAWCMGSIL